MCDHILITRKAREESLSKICLQDISLTTLNMHSLCWLQRGISTANDNTYWAIHDLAIDKWPSGTVPGLGLSARFIWMGTMYWKASFRKHLGLRNVLFFFFLTETPMKDWWYLYCKFLIPARECRPTYCHSQWVTSGGQWAHIQALSEVKRVYQMTVLCLQGTRCFLQVLRFSQL